MAANVLLTDACYRLMMCQERQLIQHDCADRAKRPSKQQDSGEVFCSDTDPVSAFQNAMFLACHSLQL